MESTPERNNRTQNLGEHKSNCGSVKKSFLTPCRRIGLGKSSGSIKKLQHENLASPIEKKKLLCERRLTVINKCITPKTENTNKFKGRHKMNSIIRSSETTKRNFSVCTNFLNQTNINNDCEQLKPSEKCNTVVEATEPLVQDELQFDNLHSEITDETLKQLALKVLEKKKQISDKGSQVIPNELLTLKESIDIWRKGAQSALQYLLQINKGRGLNVTLSELIKIHCFDVELLEFLPEEDDFS